ncbi:DNA mismatch repair protein MLH3 [Smittium mucronatum]|uniref:DNA mismatch repair protein MLH3 n=1 Tax=Smittium mucronatum TaxID=133383 RepID=A0A1R0H3Z5_9FUNG|nr:DNA mismatch repair protein MLH3 [Smittium mucronatum]
MELYPNQIPHLVSSFGSTESWNSNIEKIPVNTLDSIDHFKLTKKVTSSLQGDQKRTRKFNLDEPKIENIQTSIKQLYEEWTNPSYPSHKKNSIISVPIHPLSIKIPKTLQFKTLDILGLIGTDLKKFKVVGQLDKKFILCILGNHDIKLDVNLIAIDQHAADERIRLESFFREYRDFLLNPLINISNSGEGVVYLSKPFDLEFDFKTSQLIISNLQNLKAWGFILDIIRYSQTPRYDNRSNFNSSQLKLTESLCNSINNTTTFSLVCIPKIFHTRLTRDYKSSENHLKDILPSICHWFSEQSGIYDFEKLRSQLFLDSRISKNEESWFRILRYCPPPLVFILESMACRGAIKFNDKLSKEQCHQLSHCFQEKKRILKFPNLELIGRD